MPARARPPVAASATTRGLEPSVPRTPSVRPPCPVPGWDGDPPAEGSAGPRRGHLREAHLPAQQPPPGSAPRLPPPHGRPRRSGRPQGASPQGPEPAVGLIWRIRDRATFVDLRRRGRRVRSGPIWISYLPDELDGPHRPPRLAMAFGRRQGNAVTRNRLRRRTRAIVEDAARSGRAIPPGAYLVGGSPGVAELPFAELQRHVLRCLEQLPGAAR